MTDWIKISDTVEIMRDPVMESDFGIKNPHPMPVRAVTQVEAKGWAKKNGWRLPTEAEWLQGWGKMNHWGLWEWVAEKGKLRGGYWDFYQENAACAYRYYYPPRKRNHYFGFRCAREREK